jgi:hypothetical protein
MHTETNYLKVNPSQTTATWAAVAGLVDNQGNIEQVLIAMRDDSINRVPACPCRAKSSGVCIGGAIIYNDNMTQLNSLTFQRARVEPL